MSLSFAYYDHAHLCDRNIGDLDIYIDIDKVSPGTNLPSGLWGKKR